MGSLEWPVPRSSATTAGFWKRGGVMTAGSDFGMEEEKRMKRRPLSRKRRIKQSRQALGPQRRESIAYQRFLEGMAKHCRCGGIYCPCDGVLAGGLCDERQPNPDWHESDIYADWA